MCQPITGQCLCPPLVDGRLCERCEDNAWGYDEINGCKVRTVEINSMFLRNISVDMGRPKRTAFKVLHLFAIFLSEGK